VLKVVAQKPIARIRDQFLVLADVGAKAIAHVESTAKELLERRLPCQQAEAVAEKLSCGAWTHDYPLFAAAKELGLPVSTAMLGDVLDLMKLYPQPTRMQDGGVEYLPIRGRRDVSKGVA
jgi:ClpP class serine protease